MDPSLGLDPSGLRQQQHSPYQMPVRNATPQSGTVTPQALQHIPTNVQISRLPASPFQVSSFIDTIFDVRLRPKQLPRTTTEQFTQRTPSTPLVRPIPIPTFEIPKGKKSGGLYVLEQGTLAKATKSTALNKLVTFGTEPFHLASNRSKPKCSEHMLHIADPDSSPAALPLYTARQSIKDLKRAGADNKRLLAKLSSSRPSVAKALKSRSYGGSPSSLKREVSDSESYTESSDDDSEYTDDEEDEASPLPVARPEEPHDAVRYDVIKATWHPKRDFVNSDKIKDSLRDFYEVLNTIKKRWSADTAAVKEAEENKKVGELPVLKSRVASQRDLLQSALKAALEHTHPDVFHTLGQVKHFMVICFLFLADRFRAKDYDGPLPAVIYEILTRCDTLTSELLEETRLNKALNSMKKYANDKHKASMQKIVEIAAANSKKPKDGTPPQAEPLQAKSAKRPAPESTSRPATDGPMAKKPKPIEGPPNSVRKVSTASMSAKISSTGPTASLQKRPGERPTATAVPVKARVNQVTNKPSSIFASLNAASKKPTPAIATPPVAKAAVQAKPGPAPASIKDKKTAAPVTSKSSFSFAQIMASTVKPKEKEAAPVKTEKKLPPETSEEKAKRLRKESRRHLRVTFKPDAALVAIRYFDHDPEEEMGHDENFVRDAGDIGGEGRMFKQHKELEVDEDDEDVDGDLKPWKGLSSWIDFSGLPERDRNYAPYGGGLKLPECPEKEANVLRENATLMVFYADPKDIPPSPREPLEQAQNAAPAVIVRNFGMPDATTLSRCPQSATPVPVASLDFSNLEDIIKKLTSGAPTQAPMASLAAPLQNPYPPPAPFPTTTPDFTSLLSSLGAVPVMQAPPPAPYPTQVPAQPPLLGPDLANMLAAYTAQQAGASMGFPPPPPGLPPWPMPLTTPLQHQDPSAYQTFQPPHYNQQANGGTKRPHDDGNNNNDRNPGKKPKNRGERPHKVLPCKFFQKGTCNKGDNCTYVHDLNM